MAEREEVASGERNETGIKKKALRETAQKKAGQLTRGRRLRQRNRGLPRVAEREVEKKH